MTDGPAPEQVVSEWFRPDSTDLDEFGVWQPFTEAWDRGMVPRSLGFVRGTLREVIEWALTQPGFHVYGFGCIQRVNILDLEGSE